MPATKTITLPSGGSLTLTACDVNPFDADSREQKLLTDLSAAIRTYEKNVQAATPRSVAPESETRGDIS